MGMELREKYINPYTDFGFKKIFGSAMNKDLLISFLNALFQGERQIRDVTYKNSELLGEGETNRKAVFDVYCELEDGSHIIVEMQKAEQTYFKDRSIYYAAAPIREQAPRGHWNYELKDVYMVALLNFVFPDKEYPEDNFRHEIKLKDVEDDHVFYDKLTFIYLEMPKFTKKEDELVTMFDKWMFALSNLSRLLDRPKSLQERIFTRLFEQAEIAKFTHQERWEYEESKKEYWDYNSTIETAERKGEVKGRAEGLAEGRAEGRMEGEHNMAIETSRKMKADGMTADIIAKYTGLSIDEIEAL
jgi:predicted transposase/invertase (TIGR01784 family)